MKRSYRIALSAVAVAAMCTFIFLMSAQPADESGALSMGVVSRIIAFVVPGYEQMNAASQLYWQDTLEHVVRKCAHFSEYAALGALAANLAWQIMVPQQANIDAHVASSTQQHHAARRECGRRHQYGHQRHIIARIALLSWAASTLYAATDEFHQMFVPGRACMATDVLIDSTGAVVGVALALGIACLLKQRAKRMR
ncbi:VanZ family protein [Adlercreutzia sp. ZJ138]|uniref:VanZ family protein n=1 Tax=Adlercreutzia sp. ZJ138 TaxID=2709405 RepID=UPI0013ED3541|nr:VanZ family protein [Adlercreutzia sp. ZJ138]